jgi:hypothetical protein
MTDPNVGLNFDDWNEHNSLGTDNGAVFWLTPDHGPSGPEPFLPDGDSPPDGISGGGEDAPLHSVLRSKLLTLNCWRPAGKVVVAQVTTKESSFKAVMNLQGRSTNWEQDCRPGP